jgi:hypothetical protein
MQFFDRFKNKPDKNRGILGLSKLEKACEALIELLNFMDFYGKEDEER